jgi:hypothetical protein
MSATSIEDSSNELAELLTRGIGPDGRTVWVKASGESLAFLRDALGIDLEGLRRRLESGLGQCPTDVDGVVLAITAPMAVDEHPTRFISCCVCYERSTARVDLVWHDAASGLSGPESVPLVARDRMLIEVQRQSEVSGASAALIRAYMRWDDAFH